MGEINWITVLVNSLISLLLSFIMFAFGLRAGKERTDRLKLREKYRELYSHLNKLFEGIVDCEPLNWNHFQTSVHSKSIPPCKEMMSKGEHLELAKGIFPNIVELEKDCLVYGWYFKELSLKSGEIILKVLEENNIPLKKDSYSISTMIDGSDNKDGSYFEVNPASLLSDKKSEEYLKRLSTNDIGVRFTYVDGSRVIYSIYFRKCDIKHINMNDIFVKIRSALDSNKPDFLNKKECILERLEKNLDVLGRLTNEPHSFWGTFANTFKDFLK